MPEKSLLVIFSNVIRASAVCIIEAPDNVIAINISAKLVQTIADNDIECSCCCWCRSCCCCCDMSLDRAGDVACRRCTTGSFGHSMHLSADIVWSWFNSSWLRISLCCGRFALLLLLLPCFAPWLWILDRMCCFWFVRWLLLLIMFCRVDVAKKLASPDVFVSLLLLLSLIEMILFVSLLLHSNPFSFIMLHCEYRCGFRRSWGAIALRRSNSINRTLLRLIILLVLERIIYNKLISILLTINLAKYQQS